MKRTYIQPTIEIHQIKNVDIICGSGDTRATIPYGSNPAFDGNNIWGE